MRINAFADLVELLDIVRLGAFVYACDAVTLVTVRRKMREEVSIGKTARLQNRVLENRQHPKGQKGTEAFAIVGLGPDEAEPPTLNDSLLKIGFISCLRQAVYRTYRLKRRFLQARRNLDGMY
jgi:hypothetical protein